MTSNVDETKALLTLLVSALVANRDAVKVDPAHQSDGSVIFRVLVDAKEKGKVIGVGGRTARSLRTILTAIGKENRHNYLLDVDGFAIDEGADTFNEPVDAPYWERRQVASRRG